MQKSRKRGCDKNSLELVHREFYGAFSLEDFFATADKTSFLQLQTIF